MKPAFKFAERLGKKLSSIWLGCLLAVPFAATAQMTTYISPAVVTGQPPQVDATNFVNAGVWNIGTPLPYTTSHTLNYTNTGTMNGSVGWEFDYGSSTSDGRGLSANFFNDNNATISALDGQIGFYGSIYDVSHLIIQATNIVNKGTLSAGISGQMELTGQNVNLARSALAITPIAGVGSSNGTNNFSPDTAIYDQYWISNNTLNVGGSPWNGTSIPQFTGYGAGVPCGTATIVIGPFTQNIVADSFTNATGMYQVTPTNNVGGPLPPITLYSNYIHQAAFVHFNDPTIIPIIHFRRSLISTNPYQTVAVQMTMYSTNLTTLALQTDTLYLVDSLASATNSGLRINPVHNPSSLCTAPTERPANYIVSRIDTGDFAAGSPGLGIPSSTFYYDPLTYSNSVATGIATAYSALVDNLASEPQAGFSISNAPGKIIINANNLDLSRTRISAGAEILIQATNLIGSAGAVMDCQNLSYNIGSTSGLLNATNLAVPLVSRLHGTVSVWSGIWTNYIINVITNYTYDTNNTPPATRADITNVSPVVLVITVVDSGGLLSRVPVTVQDLVMHSTNMVVSDTMTVANTLLFDGRSLTLDGTLTLSGNVQSWTYANAPTLLYFTNNGVLNVPNDAHFGDDGPTNYAVFVNNGTISAGSETINSTYYQNGGVDNVSGGFLLTTPSGKIENGSINSGQSVVFNAGALKLNNATIAAGGGINFNVTGSLYDAGGSSGNELTCDNGFNLLVKPATGDLLGTAITSVALNGSEVDSVWAGTNSGAVAAGFSNNVALGTLVLSPQGVFEPLFRFSGVSVNVTNGLYVDDLDLSQLSTNYADMMQIDPNLVIYYASARLGFTPPANAGGIPQEPEEYLNGQFGNHLRWVSSFAGPNSSVDVLVNGQTVSVNSALRYSKIIDSNGDGIPNYYDTNPFGVPAFSVSGSLVQTNQPPARVFAISWKAAPTTVYQVQFTTNLISQNWQTIMSYTNSTTTNQTVTIWDTNVLSGQRFYRESALGQSQ